jgi:hypothetical protein
MKTGRLETKGVLAALFISLTFPSLAGAGVIVLKNGTRIEAKRVWEENGEIKCNQYGGVVGFQKRQVLRVERQQDDDELYGAQKKVLSTDGEKAIFSEVRQLYLELMSFKDDSLFQKVGFSPENKYSKWLDKVGKLKEDSRSKGLLKKGIPIEDLLNLGLEYFKSGGKETSFSRFVNEEFRKAFEL